VSSPEARSARQASNPTRRALLVTAAVVLVGALVGVAVYARREPASPSGKPTTTALRLTAAAPGGAVPVPATLDQVRRTIEARARAAGVTDVRVTVEAPRTIVVSSAKADGDRLRGLVARGQLRFRMVINSMPGAALEPESTAAPDPTDGSTVAPGGTTWGDPLAAVVAKLGPAYQVALQIKDPNELDDDTVAQLEPFSQLTPDEVAVLPPAVQFNVPTVSCAQLDRRPAGAIDAVDQQVVACELDDTATIKYLLDRATVVGSDVARASVSDVDTRWQVTLGFTSDGQQRWTGLTAEAAKDGAQRQVAVVLDNSVVTAPAIQAVIPGDAVLTADFTREQAETIASLVQSGALPLTLTVVSVEQTRSG
jgi:preprotein translocase subunit SecD